jgi:hypothetical protein
MPRLNQEKTNGSLESLAARGLIQTFSCGFSSGHLAGSGTMLSWRARRAVASDAIRLDPAAAPRGDRARLGGDGGELEVHRLGVAPGQNQSYGLSFCGTDGAEDVGRGSAEVMGSRWPGAAPGPARVILPFWPMRGSSPNQIFMSAVSTPCLRAMLANVGERWDFLP